MTTADPARHPVVDFALDLQQELPHVAALDILDHAMREQRGSHLSFHNEGPTAALYADHRDPPSPFSELLRRAFAPQLDPRELALIGLARHGALESELQQRVLAADRQWQRVIDAFAARYDLWNAHAA